MVAQLHGPDPAAKGTHSLHRSCKFQETPCQPSVVGEGWRRIHTGSLALGEQMCLPQGQPPKKVLRTKVCLLSIKESSVRGPWRGGFLEGGSWGGVPPEVLTGSPQMPLYLARGERGGGKASPGVWELLGHLSCILQPAPKHSCLQLLKEAGPSRRWGPFPQPPPGWIEGAPPWGFPDDWLGAP